MKHLLAIFALVLVTAPAFADHGHDMSPREKAALHDCARWAHVRDWHNMSTREHRKVQMCMDKKGFHHHAW